MIVGSGGKQRSQFKQAKFGYGEKREALGALEENKWHKGIKESEG